MTVMAPVSWGELLDKITILEIKAARIQDSEKVANVQRELALLEPLREEARRAQAEVARLEAELKAVNESLWEVEDRIRDCERRQDFGPAFIALARSVYRQNDQRARLKRELNLALDSGLVEEKSYRAY